MKLGLGIYLYILLVQLVGVLVFMYGFFPYNPSSSTRSSQDDVPKVDGQELSGSSKVVLMIIDALRFDFVSGPKYNRHMPFVRTLIEEGRAQLLRARAEPPTVTLPRIKAIVTGTISNYVDVIMNFGSQALNEDSLIFQAKSANKTVIFYGDETWLKLFPNEFNRREATKSFFITDFIEADQNITKNIERELDLDWDLMVLHFPGLDHIGHLEGPSSPHLPIKLEEMDRVIYQIHSKLSSNPDFFFLVCSDHGMKDGGSHGGATDPEIFIPLLIMANKLPGKPPDVINQIDLTPYLAQILALPIPANSLGVLHPALLSPLPPHTQLFYLYYNSKHISKIYCSLKPNCGQQTAFNKFLKGYKLYTQILSNLTDYKPSYISRLFLESQQEMSSFILKGLVHFDLVSIFLGVLIFFQCLILSTSSSPNFILNPFVFFKIFNFILLVYVFIRLTRYETAWFSINFVTICLVIILNSILSFNFYFMYCSFSFIFSKIKKWAIENYLYLGVTALHGVSMLSTSYIEEEHQFWYFMNTSLAILFLRSNPCDMLVVLVLQRFFRNINRTGDKWASLPDLSDWLVKSEHYYFLVIFHLMSLVLLLSTLIINDKRLQLTAFSRSFNLVLYCFLIVAIFLYKFVPENSPPIAYFWGLLTLYLFLNMFFKKRGFGKIIINAVALASCLLARPWNTILIPSLIYFSKIFSSKLNLNWKLTIFHYWLGRVFYFYFGNSNSLASIDLAPGYTGITEFKTAQVACLIIFHTFIPQILSYCLLIDKGEEKDCDLKNLIGPIVICESLTMFIFSIVAIVHRYHLFIWTVFSPKILYLGATLVVYTILIFLHFLISLFYRRFQDSLLMWEGNWLKR